MSGDGREEVADRVHSGDLTRPEQLLLCLAQIGEGQHSLGDVREVAISLGLSKANVGRDMRRLKGYAFQGQDGWALTNQGKKRVRELLGTPDPHVAAQSTALRTLLPRLKHGVQEFVTEAVECYEARHYRAAVVLSWVGAVSVLYSHVVQHRLSDFNAEATRRDQKWRAARNADDLARMKEHDFLQVLEALSVIGKNVKGELESCLRLRNGCGHPNSLKLAESRCAGHVELLVLNVFDVFA